MGEQPKYVKFFRDSLEKAYDVKVVNIIVVLDKNNHLVHSQMDHPQPITRPILMDILQSLREQVIRDYEKLEKSASSIENAESILSIAK